MNNAQFDEAFRALQDPKEPKCNAFGIFSIFRISNKMYLRLTDAVECAHIWYIHDPKYGWKGLDDTDFCAELSVRVEETNWPQIINPIIAFAMQIGGSLEREDDNQGSWGVH